MSGELIKKVHIIKSALGWTDEMYRDFLAARFRVKSSKQLPEKKLWQLVDELEDRAVAAGVWRRYRGAWRRNTTNMTDTTYKALGKKYAELDGRPGMASGAQLRMIEAIWRDVSRVGKDSKADEKQVQTALRGFVKRITGVDALRFLESIDARKIIKALDTMKGGR